MAKNIAWSICQGRWRSVSVWRLAFGVRRSAFGGRAKISARRQSGYLQARFAPDLSRAWGRYSSTAVSNLGCVLRYVLARPLPIPYGSKPARTYQAANKVAARRVFRPTHRKTLGIRGASPGPGRSRPAGPLTVNLSPSARPNRRSPNRQRH